MARINFKFYAYLFHLPLQQHAKELRMKKDEDTPEIMKVKKMSE
jgi:hypothetical protein